MRKLDKRRLMVAAIKAREGAFAPYSGFQVGAALLTASGKIIGGANVESASYGLTCCAERVTLFKALTDGERNFEAIAVAAAIDGGPLPCGACRQLLAEHAPAATVWIADVRKPTQIRRFSVGQLLPKPFVLARAGPARQRPSQKR